jgi:hypothetical protein
MSECLSVFRLQPQANLKAKQWNKIGKNGINTCTCVFSENISVDPRSWCAVCCACRHGLSNRINCITDVTVASNWKCKTLDFVFILLSFIKKSYNSAQSRVPVGRQGRKRSFS